MPEHREKGSRAREELEADVIAQARHRRQQDLEAGLRERFLVKGNEYRFRGNEKRVAFEDHGRKLTSSLELPSVIRALVDLAEAKGWQSLRIGEASSTEFRKAIWVEATMRGIRALGHEPTAEDHARLDTALRSRSNPIRAASMDPQQAKNPARSAPAELAAREAAARGVDDPTVLSKVRNAANEKQAALAKIGQKAVARVIDPSEARPAPHLTPSQPAHVRPARTR